MEEKGKKLGLWNIIGLGLGGAIGTGSGVDGQLAGNVNGCAGGGDALRVRTDCSGCCGRSDLILCHDKNNSFEFKNAEITVIIYLSPVDAIIQYRMADVNTF